MKERGKAVETKGATTSNILPIPEYNSSPSDLPCKKHPSSSSIGVCAQCLKERLIKLVCSDCGEQRLSSCSCSEVSSYRNSSVSDVGSVGRVSFLIERERGERKPQVELKSEEIVLLKRSSSSSSTCVKGGIWRIVRLFRRKREKGCERREEKGEMWVFDYVGVSRSRSLCSFRGEEISDFAKISDFNSERPSGFSEGEPRKSGVFKESDFCGVAESGFIDLKLDLETEPKPECSVSDLESLRGSFGGSCRIADNGIGIRREKKRGKKGWRWFFRKNRATMQSELDNKGVITSSRPFIL